MLIALLLLGLSACKKELLSLGDESTPIISMSEERIIMPVGSTHRLQLTYPISGVEWSSSADSVASVDYRGVVTALSVGEAAVVAARQGRTDTCRVEVVEAN